MNKNYVTYQLYIRLDENVSINVGKLGFVNLRDGLYIYTGSAKKNMAARIERHRRKNKKLHWHIDYLTSLPNAHIEKVTYHTADECTVNQKTNGSIPVAGFGASDCKKHCISHLKFIG